MTVSTTISSTSVNPLVFSLSVFMTSPFPVWNPVQPGVLAAGVNVVHILPWLRLGRGAGIAAQAPFLAADRIGRHAAQEVDLRAVGLSLVLDAVDQHLQLGRI